MRLRRVLGAALVVLVVGSIGCRPAGKQNAPSTVIPVVSRDLGLDAPSDLAMTSYPVYDLAAPLPPGDAGILPPMACAADADCPLPPSVCGNRVYLIYYTNPRCVSGLCRFDRSYMACDDFCDYNGCQVVITSREPVSTPSGT